VAEPTIDSLSSQTGNAPVGAVPLSGPGSKTPANPPLGGGTPIGGGPPIKPAGQPGAPEKDSPDAVTPLDQDSFGGLVDDIYQAIDDQKVRARNSEEIINFLLENKWSENRLRDLSKYLKTSIKNMVVSIKNHIKSDGVNETIDLIKKKVKSIQDAGAPEQGLPPLPPNPIGSPGSAIGAGPGQPLAPPVPGAVASLDGSRLLTDVDLEIINKRGFNMSKVIIKDGAVVDSSAYAKELIDKLSDSIRSVKSSIKKYDDVKVKYAGALALKKAIEEVGMGGALGSPGMGASPDLGMGDAGEEGGEEGKLDTIIQKLDEMSGDIAELKGEEEEAGADLEGDTDALDDIAGEAEKESDGIPGKEGKDIISMVEEARTIVATAKRKLRENITASFEDMIKAKKEKADKKDGKDEKKDEKKENPFKKKEDDKDDKKATVNLEDLIVKVKARLEEVRAEKEANLYPFKKEIKPIPPVDNINAETAGKQISTADSEIKGQPVKDKDMETLNHGDIGQKDMPYKTEGKSTPEKKVSIEVAERIRKHSVQNAIDKARLSVELASRQQLKGMIDDPLRASLTKNLVEAGIDPETADAVIHNAYIDAYEESHKAIMKEAFDTFMEKDFDEFTKIAKFVDEYKVKQAEVSPVEDKTEESSREKEASIDAPLRGFSVDKDARKEMYSNYWKHVSNNRGIVRG
jgi:hypothetical protein